MGGGEFTLFILAHLIYHVYIEYVLVMYQVEKDKT